MEKSNRPGNRMKVEIDLPGCFKYKYVDVFESSIYTQ